MKPRCLIIGAPGQLGRALCAELRGSSDVFETAHHSHQPGQWHLDLADPSTVRRVIEDIRPDWILIAGVLGNVDRAEVEPALCRAVNVEGPRAVAECAQAAGAAVVYYSTDTVFDGANDGSAEDDPVAPVNAYARSKVEAETVMRALLPRQSLIIRTAWLYGPDARRRNFVLRLVDDARAGRRTPVPDDQWGSPTFTEDVARVTRLLLERGCRGIYHAVGPEFVNRADLARQVCRQFGLEERFVLAQPTAALQQPARRPLRVRLDCAKLRSVAPEASFRTLADGLEVLKTWEAALVS